MKITGIFDYMNGHRRFRVLSLVLLSLTLLGLVLSLHFSEDISDFLPLGTREREHLSVYQNISGAERIVVLFSNPESAERTIGAIDDFVGILLENDNDKLCGELTYQFDTDDISEVSSFVYENIPYFLTEKDYARMDSLLSVPGYVQAQLKRDRQMLLLPTSSMLSGTVVHDPLALFSSVMSRLQASSGQLCFEMVDGYIFTPDMSRAVLLVDSPFGSSETENNARLLKLLEGAAERMHEDYPEINVSITGGPAIAVTNSTRIKKDSFIAVSLSVILIILLLAYAFNSLRNIVLIFLSVGWGLLFALGGMALFSDRVSIIVIGISSVILGIAVNYPLHLVAQAVQQPDRRAALREIASPLVVGNITTVGAFLSLIPLKSAALRDLGIFASLLLVGTILFVLFYLPHLIEVKRPANRQSRLLDSLSRARLEDSKAVMAGIVAVTAALLWFSGKTEFDSNISNINYMTSSQRSDLKYFEDLLTSNHTHTAQTLYLIGEGEDFDAALSASQPKCSMLDSLRSEGLLVPQNELSSFMVSEELQTERLELWKDFVSRHADELGQSLDEAAAESGFSQSAFRPFKDMVNNSEEFEPQGFEYFDVLTSSVFTQNFTSLDASGKSYVVNALNVEPENVDEVKACLGSDCFAVSELSNALSRSLSDNFNYIGWACSLIVFFFLWFSFGRLELALISFLPMAISWVWILGLMSLLGIKFNIVNVILATFIFGQGDDYTIFMTEGCQYEYARRKPIMASYRSSILESAAIMFVGMGTLIVAKHPAMRSLAEVTLIGMLSVVLMAYVIPPFLFKWLTTKNGRDRICPLSIRSLICGAPSAPYDIVLSRYVYRGKEIENCVRRNLRKEAAALSALDLSGVGTYEYADGGYGELALLLALSNPSVRFRVRMIDQEHLELAQIASAAVADNIEFYR